MDEDDFDSNFLTECEVCGTKDFYVDAGFYYCNVCQTQSQESRVFVEEQTYISGFHTRLGVLKKKKDKSVRDAAHRFATWEVYNLIIKSLTDKLIDMGYPTILKDKVFQLYAAYLLKRRAILTSQKWSAVTQNESIQNVYALYDRKVPKRPIRPKKRKKAANEEHDLSLSAAKRRKTNMKRKAFEQEYLEHQSQIVETETTEEYSVLDVIPPPLNKFKRDGGSLQATDALQKVTIAMKKHGFHAGSSKRHYLNRLHRPYINRYMGTLLKVEKFNMRSVMILLFVALRQIGCKVLFSDINRMFSEGTLKVTNIGALLNPVDLRRLNLTCTNLCSPFVTSFNICSAAPAIDMFLLYLNIKDFPYPKFDDFFSKFTEDLVLPNEFTSLVRQVNKGFQVDEKGSNKNLKLRILHKKFLPELCIVPIIIVVLKMLFGLDDTTERYQSQFAKLVNQIIDERELDMDEDSEWCKLFVLEDWVSFIRYRQTVIQHEVESATICDQDHLPNARNVQHGISEFGDQHGSGFKYSTRIKDASNEVKTMFQQVSKDLHDGQESPTLPRYRTPRLPRQDIIQTFIDHYPNVSCEDANLELLQQSFLKRRIDFVYNPDKYIAFLHDAGYKVKRIRGDALNYEKNLVFRKNIIPLFQPYKKFNHDIGSPVLGTISDNMKFLLSISTSLLGGKELDTANIKKNIDRIGAYSCKVSLKKTT